MPVNQPKIEGSSYQLPEHVGRDWNRDQKSARHPDYTPTARQRVLIAAVEKALDDGIFYNNDLRDRVAKDLAVDEATLARNNLNVVNGDFGHDIYQARLYVEAFRKRDDDKKVGSQLLLRVGENIGTLVFIDFKKTTSVVVTAITEAGDVHINGKRGGCEVTGAVSMSAIRASLDRAMHKGYRKDGYEAFVAGRKSAAAGAAA